MSRHLSLLLLVLALAGCGSSTNVLGLLTPEAHKESFDNLLDLAQAAFDRGDLATAEKYSKAAYAMDQGSERAALLYGSVNLALAGGDPFTLAKALIAQSKAGTGSGTGKTAGVLGSLKTVLHLDSSALTLMGTLDTSDPALPVLIPGCAEAVRPNVPQLVYVAAAINAVCPFVDASARITADHRQDCFGHEGRVNDPSRAAFLWAFTNLVEALAFDSVLTYATVDPTGQKSNLQLRVEKVQSLDTKTDVGPLIAAAQSLDQTVKAVMPPGGVCSAAAPTSLLQATLHDLLAASAAFKLIPGVPAHVASGLQDALASVQATAQDAQAAALKADFSKGLAGDLAAKIDAAGTDPDHPLSPDQKAALCASYGSIAQGTGQGSAVCGSP